jgi:hypothetical protein
MKKGMMQPLREAGHAVKTRKYTEAQIAFALKQA